MRNIQYAFHRDDGSVISRVGSEVAWPVLDFMAIGRGGGGFEPGNFHGPMNYNLARKSVHGIGREWDRLVWTKYVPTQLKNLHREFWGMKPLPTEPDRRSINELCNAHNVAFYFTREYDIGNRAANSDLVGIYHSQWGEKTRTGLFHWFKKHHGHYVFFGITERDEHEYENFKEIRHRIQANQHNMEMVLQAK